MNDRTIPTIHSGHVLGAVAAVFMPMALLLAKGVAPLFAAAALAMLVLGLVRDRKVPLVPGPVTLSLAAIAAFALISWFWSITPDETVKTGISLAATFFGGAVLIAGGAGLDGRGKRVYENGLIVGGLIGFALIAFEMATNAWLTRFLYGMAGKSIFNVNGSYTPALKPGLAASALFVWPWALAVWSRYRRVVSPAAIAAAVLLVLWSGSDTAIFGLAVGAAVFAAGLALPRQMTWILGVAVAAGVLTAPMIPDRLPDPMQQGPHLAWLTPSAAHRLVIWRTTAGHIKKKPLLGGGFDTARGLYSKKDKVELRFPKGVLGRSFGPTWYEPIPLHPHNAILQVWLELGAVGAAILVALLLAVIRAVHRLVDDTRDRAIALGAIATGLAIASISFGAWQSWWVTSMLLAGIFMVSVLSPLAGPGRTRMPQPEAPADPGPATGEIGGPKGPEPTRYGDWERKGRAIDF
ncbi:MAG: DUF1674 domain-containing protein [Rhodospirillales bacterium]